jgi:hypothetical protein
MASIEVADVFRQFAPSYLERFGDRILPSHRRAIQDIIDCRTGAMGGHVHQCDDCGLRFYVYHACRNRACPACHTQQTQEWLEARKEQLLPCGYYHLCVTVPAPLREVLRSNQSDGYAILIRAAAQAVRTLCDDTRYLGAMPAILAVLHTWTGAMDYHPHIHLLVSAGGIGPDLASWHEPRRTFLVPVRALSKLVRRLFHEMVHNERPDLLDPIPKKVWTQQWVAWCKPWGRGETGVLDYLARYVFRIAITNARLVDMDERTVTFRYKDRKAGYWRTCTLTGHEFMRRFLQHVLPKGLHKVRYYALWHPKRRTQLHNARRTLLLRHPQQAPETPTHQTPEASPQEDDTPVACPYCGSLHTRCLGPIPRHRTAHASRAPP